MHTYRKCIIILQYSKNPIILQHSKNNIYTRTEWINVFFICPLREEKKWMVFSARYCVLPYILPLTKGQNQGSTTELWIAAVGPFADQTASQN